VTLRGGPIEIDASQVERLGGLCLQVLLSARQTWAADGHSARLSQTSPAFDDYWALFGAPAFDPSPSPGLNQGSPA
jgi:chemotaxis protein CheX